MLTKSFKMSLPVTIFFFTISFSALNVALADSETGNTTPPLKKDASYQYTVIEVTPAKEMADTPAGQKNSSNVTDTVKAETTVENISDGKTSTILRSQLTTAIVNREPTDDVVLLTNNSSKIYYFNELSNLKGHHVTHRWQYQGKTMAEIDFDVKSDRWRVFSSKKIRPDWTGEWSVVLTDENGVALKAENFQIVDAANR